MYTPNAPMMPAMNPAMFRTNVNPYHGLQNPDDLLVAIFCNLAIENPSKSVAAGRPIYDDIEHVEIRTPGSRDTKFFPATEKSEWTFDQVTGRQYHRTYAERFSRQYQQFKMQVAQTKSGTPLSFAPFLTEARRAELRALNIYTIEALANIDGQEL